MKKCFRCHADISDKALFCTVCGAKQPTYQQQTQTQPQPQTQHQTQIKYQPSNQQQQQYGHEGNRTPSRENGKGNGALWAVVGFLAAAVIGLGVWIVYDKVINKEEPPVVAPAPHKEEPSNTTKNDEKTEKKVKVTKEQANPKTSTNKPNNTASSLHGSYNLTGAIDKYPITMNISITDGNVAGTYYYHSQGRNNKMTVNGYMTSDRRIHLEEYAPNTGLNTGYFDGTFDGNYYEGHFSNYQKESHLYFSLHTY